MNKNSFSIKKWIGRFHLWLGLTSGLVVFIISITGSLYAFKDEIESLTQSYRFIQPENKSYLLPTDLQERAEKALLGKHAHSITYNKDKAAEIVFYNSDPAYYYTIFINPYSGKITKVKDMDSDFFNFVLDGHFYLWLPPDIGQPLVASATLIFVFMLITGLVLWWPKSRNGIKQRFSIKRKSSWKRKNYDLHNVLGFYISLIVLVIAITGLVWGFSWFAKGYYTIIGGEKTTEYSEPLSDSTLSSTKNIPSVDKIWQKIYQETPEAYSIEIHYPETNKSAIATNINPGNGTYWQRDFRYFDQHTLNEFEVDHIYGRFKNAKFADKLYRMNYDIHIGAIGGFPGKFLAFCVSLISASLPVTGFLVWFGRKKKKNLKKRHKNLQPVTL